MAEIRDDLVLDIDQALRQIDQIERSLDDALAPVEVRVEVDASEAERLEETLQEIERIAERANTETSSMALAAGRAETNFEDLARAMGITEDEARRITGELLESQAASNRLEDSARDVARQLGLSDNEAERLTRSLRDADRAAEAIDVTTLSVGQRFAALRTSAAAIATILAGVGGTAILVGALAGANAAIQSFARLEDSINAVNVTFGTAASAVLNFGKTAAQSAGLSAEAFNQAVVPIGSLLQNFGFDAQQAADGAVVLVQRAADLASVMGGSVNDALLAVGAALRGEADPLERYGASISAARVEQFALAQGLARTKAELTPALLLQARYGLILEDTARVAGDFANTSGDLANAQRIASAAVQNFVADLGEELAPALEAILVLLPEMLEGLRQLVPGFAAAAGSAAGFFESVGEGGGFRTEFAAISAGFEAVTAGAGIATEAGSIFASVFRNDLRGAIDSGKQLAGLFAGGIAQGIGVNLARQLDTGTDAVTAFRDAIRQTASLTSDFGTFTDSFRDFAIAADLTDLQLRDVTQELINNASALGLTSEEVAFLTTQLALLNSFLFTDIEAVRQFNFETRALAEGSLDTVTTRFTTFISDLEGIPPRMDSVAIDMRTAAGVMGEALNPFDEATEEIEVSAEEFFERLIEEINEQAAFQSGIAQLIMREQFDLAAFLGPQGPAVQEALTGFLEDVDLAEATNRALAGEGTEFSRAVGEELTGALASGDITPDMEQAFIGMLEDGIFSNTQVEDAIISGTASSAVDTISSFRVALENEAAAFDASFLAASIGAAIGASLDFSDQAAAAASATVNAYEQTFKDEFEISSPSKLMMRLGEEVAAGFLEGSEMGELQLRTAAPAITGGIATGTAVGGVAGGVNINLTTVNPTQQDQVSDVARMGQIASSIANSWRSVVPNGM